MALTVLLLYAIIALLSVIVYFWHRNLNYWKTRGIPHDAPHPIYGNIVGFRKTTVLHDAFLQYYRKYRDCGAPFVGFFFANKASAFILDKKLAKNILIRDFSNFVNRNFFHNEQDDPLTGHLFAVDGAKWRQMRHKLSPTFTSGKMKFMYPTIVNVAERFVNVLTNIVPPRGTGANTLEIKDIMARFTTDVIGTCVFGIECNSLTDPKAQFHIMGRKAINEVRHNRLIFALISGFPKLAEKIGMKITRQDVHDYFMGLVHATVAMREKENIKRNDFLNILIELKNTGITTMPNGEVVKGLTMNDLAANSFLFFLAGFETSSSTMSYALYELARHQDVQDKLREEIYATLKKHDQNLTYECIQDMHFLNQVISETLRIHTLVPHLNRIAQKDYVVPGHPNFVIEAGTSVLIPAVAYHHDPDIYPEPEKFKPERFSPEMVAARDSIEWLPFGEGPRNCIGMRFGQMQIRVGLTQLIKNFKFSVSEKTQIPLVFDPKPIVLSTLGGIYLNVERF